MSLVTTRQFSYYIEGKSWCLLAGNNLVYYLVQYDCFPINLYDVFVYKTFFSFYRFKELYNLFKNYFSFRIYFIMKLHLLSGYVYHFFKTNFKWNFYLVVLENGFWSSSRFAGLYRENFWVRLKSILFFGHYMERFWKINILICLIIIFERF